MSLQQGYCFQKFWESLANEELSYYLLLRWSFSTYMAFNKKETDMICSKLDTCMIKRFKKEEFDKLEEIEIMRKIKEKQNLSDYLSTINDFYRRIFEIPEKLKKY